jgi:hypothetical protein
MKRVATILVVYVSLTATPSFAAEPVAVAASVGEGMTAKINAVGSRVPCTTTRDEASVVGERMSGSRISMSGDATFANATKDALFLGEGTTVIGLERAQGAPFATALLVRVLSGPLQTHKCWFPNDGGFFDHVLLLNGKKPS